MSLNESENSSGQNREAKNGVTGSVDTLDSQLLGEIPHKMSDTVEGVEGEGECNESLQGELGNQGDGGESVGKGGRVNVNAKSRASGVSAQQSVESTTESDTGDSVQTRKVPGQLGLVDVEMGGGGSKGSLLVKDVQSLGRGGGLGLEASVGGKRTLSERRSSHWVSIIPGGASGDKPSKRMRGRTSR